MIHFRSVETSAANRSVHYSRFTENATWERCVPRVFILRVFCYHLLREVAPSTRHYLLCRDVLISTFSRTADAVDANTPLYGALVEIAQLLSGPIVRIILNTRENPFHRGANTY